MTAAYPPIGDYALIGDCRGAGLVSRDGSLDWLCLPRFDSPSLFAALLDAREGGRFQVRPAGDYHTERRYLPDTNVIETTFHCPGGIVVLRDLMPVASEEEKRRRLVPEHEILREIEGAAGEVEMEVIYDPRPDYGRIHPVLRQRGRLGLWCRARPGDLILTGDIPLTPLPGGAGARGSARIREGERAYLSLTYSEIAPAVIPALGAAARERI